MDGLDEDDIILSLITIGPKFLKDNLNENNKSQISKYIVEYLTNNTIFGDGIINFSTMIFDDDKKCYELWELAQQSCSDNIILTTLSQIFIASKNIYKFSLKCNVLQQVLNYDKIKKLLCNDYIWNVKNGYNIEHNSILGIIFYGLSPTDEKWMKKISMVHKIFDQLVRYADLRSYIIKWFAYVFNYNIIKLSMTYDSTTLKKISDNTFLTNVLGLLIHFWNVGVIDKRNNTSLKMAMIDRVNCNYIISQDCPIKWYDKDDSVNIENPNFLSQIFFLILNGLRIAYLPTTKIFETWPDLLVDLENEKNLIETSSTGILSELTLMAIYNKINFVKNSIDESERIIQNKSISSMITTFYDHFIVWYSKYGKDNLKFDDVFIDMMDYYLVDYKIKDIHNDNLIKLLLEITSTNIHTKNPMIKYNSHNLLFIKKMTNTDSVNSIAIIEAFMKLVISINKFRGDNPVQTFLYKRHVYKNINKIVKSIDITHFNHVINNNSILSRKFAMIIVNDLVWLGDNINPLINELNSNTLDDKTSFKKSKFLYEILEYFTSINSVLYNLINDSILFRNVIRSNEIISNFALVMNLSFKWLADDLHYTFPYVDVSSEFKKQLNFDKFKNELVDEFNIMKDNTIFVQTLIDDNKVFNVTRFENLQELSDFTKILKDLLDKQTNDDIVYPDEFLDPIMCTKIQTPVMLPDGDNVFVEKSIIEKHLLTEETNPFNRNKLTIQQLEEYNNTPEIKEKINDFNKRLQLWESQNKKK